MAGGEIVERDGKKYKIFYGMSSSTAMKKHAGGVAEYRFVFYTIGPSDRTLPAQPISIQKTQSRRKKPTNLCTPHEFLRICVRHVL